MRNFSMLTLFDMPNTSTIWAKTAARFAPEWDFATSTISSNIQVDMPLLLEWTVTATKALWLGEVHASVAKLKAPLCSLR
jgi:hypothetical protein